MEEGDDFVEYVPVAKHRAMEAQKILQRKGKSLMSVRELAKGITYTDPLLTGYWKPPLPIRRMSKKTCSGKTLVFVLPMREAGYPELEVVRTSLSQLLAKKKMNLDNCRQLQRQVLDHFKAQRQRIPPVLAELNDPMEDVDAITDATGVYCGGLGHRIRIWGL
ncbi:hypothetical protein LWI28_000614 [Acer negundo]|uniref:Uncharacterized protein n=1 Tax=Acer negundo TaxID=4023 RepID=A0AAD5IC65_ACENE|nr:hypothetical protein LWI28_000614 [Acer negundo]